DSIISPKKTVTDVVARYARALENTRGSSKMETLYRFMDEKAEAAEFKIHADFPYLNIPLKDLHLKENALIGGIVRKRKVMIPSGSDVIQEGDRVIAVTGAGMIRDLTDVIR
ncbi:MAG: Trk system potassium transporter TrkA, partial [Clostridia bacterium]|nr:Trk system potassium transporter TrkA [Clostridia bacterium]